MQSSHMYLWHPTFSTRYHAFQQIISAITCCMLWTARHVSGPTLLSMGSISMGSISAALRAHVWALCGTGLRLCPCSPVPGAAGVSGGLDSGQREPSCGMKCFWRACRVYVEFGVQRVVLKKRYRVPVSGLIHRWISHLTWTFLR